MMKILISCVLFAAAIMTWSLAEDKTDKSGTTSNSGGLFPNDAGPTEIDVSSYPKEYQETYGVFRTKCAACHTIARPINCQFLELTPEEMNRAKAEEPDLFKDSRIVQPEENILKRCVKRMMFKPGCPVKQDGKRIWSFLVYDAKVRKMGANARIWRDHRAKLLEDFKKNNPEAYLKLFPEEGNTEKKP